MRSVVFVAGARPNFVKVAALLRAMARRSGTFDWQLVHTGQHYDAGMSDIFFAELGIPPPATHLNVGPGNHGAQTGKLMGSFEGYVLALATKPQGVVVVGDVNSTMACALVSSKLGIPVAHVEAGLRSFDRTMPEEINRVVTDSVSDVLLVSEPSGVTNLRREGIEHSRIRYCGNVMIDTLVHQLEHVRASDAVARLGLQPGRYVLATLHRPSNVDSYDRLAVVVDFLGKLALQLPVVFPVHPRTARRLDEMQLRSRLADSRGVTLCAPLGYRDFVALMRSAALVVTDSGGIQEETTYLDVPCVTLRSNTERPATVTHGTNTLVGDDLDKALAITSIVLAGTYKHAQPIEGWDGNASDRVIDALVEIWS